MKTKTNYLNVLKETFILTVAVAIIAAAVYFFLVPSHTSVSSISGLGIVLTNFIPLPLSAISMILNIALLIIGFFTCGREFGVKTVYTSIMLPFFLWLFEMILPDFDSMTNSQELDVLCYILVVSVGLSILFNRNASSGGLDIVAKILNKYAHMDLGKAMSLSGMCVALSAALVYDKKTVVLSILGTYFNGMVLDHFIFDHNIKRRVCIITKKEEELRNFIIHDLHSGATIYESIGAYNMQKRNEIITIVDKSEYQKLMNHITKEGSAGIRYRLQRIQHAIPAKTVIRNSLFQVRNVRFFECLISDFKCPLYFLTYLCYYFYWHMPIKGEKLMPKCRKRRICREPDYVIFQSENGLDDVTTLTVDEYEAIRQIDMEGLSQEECAKKMCVARTTAQLIYNSARKKIAESIVLGKSIRIEGGNYILCDGSPCCENCCKSTQPVNYMQKKGENVMRIAVTYENGEVFQHFGRTENFKIYEVENNKIVNSQVMGSNGIGHGALAGLLSGNQIDVLICGGIGGGAQVALANAGITLCSGASGDTDKAVEAYLRGELTSAGATCSHHSHEEGHACGNHGCGHH